MNENTRIELLAKLVGEKDIIRLLKQKRSEEVIESVQKEEKDKYLSEGWIVGKEFKNSVKMSKPKSPDLILEDEVWSLFALMGYKFLNKDRNFNLPYEKDESSQTKQIDVFAKDDETILIVECKSSQINRKGDFKKELESYAGSSGDENQLLNNILNQEYNGKKVKDLMAKEDSTADELKSATEKLMQNSMKLGEAIYKASQASSSQSTENSSSTQGQEANNSSENDQQSGKVVDAEYEEIKEEKEGKK